MKRLVLALLFVPAFSFVLQASDWPQYQHDPARSGYTHDAPQPPFSPTWSHDFVNKNKDEIHPAVQAIIADGKVFIPSRRGRVYALDAGGGEQLWIFEKAGPILHSVAVADGMVFFGSMDGKVYAINAEDGTEVWHFFVDIRGFCVAPCLAQGKVFMGARSGMFCCLDQKTGRVLWTTDTGGFVFHTAAYAQNKLYVGNEEMKLLCLDGETGDIIWKTDRLYGVSFTDSFAFVDHGKVVVRTWNTAVNTGLKLNWNQMEASVNTGTYMPIPDAAQDELLALMKKEEPFRRELYVFDAETGKQLYIPVHSKMSTVDGPAFSVCSDGRGHWCLAIAPAGLRTWQAFARMDPNTGRLVDLIWTPKCKTSNSDEANAFTVGGNILYCSEQENGEAGIMTAFNLDKPENYGFPSRRDGFGFQGLDAFEYDAMPLCDPMPISGDKIYKITNHTIQCWTGRGDKEAQR